MGEAQAGLDSGVVELRLKAGQLATGIFGGRVAGAGSGSHGSQDRDRHSPRAYRGTRNRRTSGSDGGHHRAMGHAFWRRPAVILAVALDIAVAIGAVLAILNGFSPIVLAFAAILAMAPWAAIIDDAEKPKRG
jgi:hypothetical protein